MSYDGPAHIGENAVRVRLRGRFEPVDGRYHWGGRIEPDPDIARLVRAGRRDVRLVIGDRAAPARLGDVDPWGGVRITGVGAPPWPVEATEGTEE